MNTHVIRAMAPVIVALAALGLLVVATPVAVILLAILVPVALIAGLRTRARNRAAARHRAAEGTAHMPPRRYLDRVTSELNRHLLAAHGQDAPRLVHCDTRGAEGDRTVTLTYVLTGGLADDLVDFDGRHYRVRFVTPQKGLGALAISLWHDGAYWAEWHGRALSTEDCLAQLTAEVERLMHSATPRTTDPSLWSVAA